MENQQSTMTNLWGEELPLLFRRLDVGSLSEGIAFESRLIRGRWAADTTLGHTDCNLREVQKTRKTEISEQKMDGNIEESWVMEQRARYGSEKDDEDVGMQRGKIRSQITKHNSMSAGKVCWRDRGTFDILRTSENILKPEKSQAFILDVCGARDNGSMHYDYCTLFKTVRVYECVFLWPAGSNAVGFERGSAPPWLL